MNDGMSNLSWFEVEAQIEKETIWLRDSIKTYNIKEKDSNGNILCENCILRRLSFLIVSDNIMAQEMRARQSANFWQASSLAVAKSYHGKEWHRSKMEEVEKHFLSLDYNIERQPHPQLGRADLGAYKGKFPPVYVEIGTTSLFKLLYNLTSTQSMIYLIVPDNDRLIEFRKL